jgi:hypothetical protein
MTASNINNLNITVSGMIPVDLTYEHSNFNTTQGVVTYNTSTRKFGCGLGSYELGSDNTIISEKTVTVSSCDEFINNTEITSSSLLAPDSTLNNGQ